MIKFYLLPILALLGILFAVRTVILGSVPPMAAPPVVEPPKAPFPKVVAGVGIIEAISENIAVAAHIGGVVSTVHVAVGDVVTKGDRLFSIDDRDALANLGVRKAELLVAEAEAKEAVSQLAIIDKVSDSRAISKELRITRQAAFDRTRANVERAIALVSQAKTDLELLSVKAPITGQVLQVKVRPGEFAPALMITTPLLLIGAVDRFGVRVDIDENDAWRVKAGAAAVAFVRGNTQLSAPLTFVRFEPYVVPKRSLTGESSERVDTRVLQVIYSMDPKALPVFVGQLLDVYVEDVGSSVK